METMHPPMEPLRLLLDRLTSAGVTAALGGSGLLYAHGLVQQVRDWDLTTDAPPEQARRALEGLTYTELTGGKGFATAGRFVVCQNGHELDLMSRFAIEADGVVCHLPTLVTGHWQGIPLGSLEVWAAAYGLMGRSEKTELTLDHLRKHGADPECLARILAEPLPKALHQTLEALR